MSPSFEAFFRAHHRDVVRLAHHLTGDFHRAQDVAQEVFVAAHRRFADHPEGAGGWVRVATVHTALNQLRGDRRRHRRHLRVGATAHAPSAEEAVVEREERASLGAALAKLPRRSATALLLRHSGLSYAEVAEAVGVSVGSVGTILRRAEAALSKELRRATQQ
ncbi:MAG TPA: RNA polymerase sigma factor [Acidimicrobiales bacterium]|nr:RNA polymerase sigma factor [Acidimicrobiales bacterium]